MAKKEEKKELIAKISEQLALLWCEKDEKQEREKKKFYLRIQITKRRMSMLFLNDIVYLTDDQVKNLWRGTEINKLNWIDVEKLKKFHTLLTEGEKTYF